ncbi:MAG: RNA polymerase subunit sigma, partial [Paenisporosarcina sp.]
LGVTYINNSSSNKEIATQNYDLEEAKIKTDESVDENTANSKIAGDEEVSIGTYSDEASPEITIEAIEPNTEPVRAVYEEEVENHTVFQIGLAGNQANSVPVTILIPNNIIQNDFAGATPSQLDMYQQYAPQINEETLGFSEYHPYKGKFKTEGESLIHVLPKNHDYDLAGGAFGIYQTSLMDTFDEYKDIRFQNEDGSTVEFDQVGEPSKPLPLTKNKLMQNYYLFTSAEGKEYLTPNFGQTYKTITDALEAMKGNPNGIYTTLIPRGINFEIKEEDNLVRIHFTEPLDLETLDPKVAMYLIEGILLTGASFQQTIQMDNVIQSNWNGFDFTKPLPMPIGPNKMIYESIQ